MDAVRIAPATRGAIRRALNAWYALYRRDLPWRRTSDPYSIWISEVMLQQTQVKTVIPYFRRFIGRFPDVHRLARADLQMVLKNWEGLGYYSRARNLHKAAGFIADQMDGRFPQTWNELRQLPGIGDYIASAVSSIAFGLPHAVVDGNVKRVLARLFQVEAPVNHAGSHVIYHRLADQLLDRARPGDHNQAMMELGAVVCIPRRPLCSDCPVSKSCNAFKADAALLYPKRLKSAPLPVRHVAVGVVEKKGRILLIQRSEAGLLGGLWEFPGGVINPGQEPVQVCRDRIEALLNLEVKVGKRLATVHHSYTHFKLRMDVFQCRWMARRVHLAGPASFKWIKPVEITDYPLHGAMHKAIAKGVLQFSIGLS